MKRSSSGVPLALTVIAASSLSGCAADEPDYAAICVNPQTQERVDDDDCDDGDHPADYDGDGGGFFWYYVATSSNGRVPAVGKSYTSTKGTFNGSKVTKSHSVVRGGAPKSGGSSFKSTTKSGGFGSSKGVSSS
jgi:hypothetical protein